MEQGHADVVVTAGLRPGMLSRLEVQRIQRCAAYHARRRGMMGRLTPSEVDDLGQDIVLEILSRVDAFDSGRSPFGAFVDLLAAHAASRHGERIARPRRLVAMTSLSTEVIDAFYAATADGVRALPNQDRAIYVTDVEHRIMLRRLIMAVPEVAVRIMGVLDAQHSLATVSRATACRRRP